MLVSRPDDVVVVSGLPRSGTSLMMAILEAAGLPLLVDDLRPPDRDNPRGYFEYQPVKALASDSRWIDLARGKAVKVIYRLVRHLPPHLRYRVVFMDRALTEVLASQDKMVQRLSAGAALTAEETARVAGAYRSELAAVRDWLDRQPNISVLVVDHAALLREPARPLQQLRGFLELGDHVSCAQLRAVIDPGLHRNRAAS
ncbi:MAG TPA: hypothetical protein VHW23_30635 [Kofleriaceae bacterium]|jgi:hypothetical protein|nr:hypothetical protein [Kofleriaceae bacterium]